MAVTVKGVGCPGSMAEIISPREAGRYGAVEGARPASRSVAAATEEKEGG